MSRDTHQFINDGEAPQSSGWRLRAAWLWCRNSLGGCEFETGLCHPMTGKLSLTN